MDTQSVVNTRSQVRFQVQPQVTIAVNPTYPLSEDVQRKDFLMCVHDMGNNHADRKHMYKGTPVVGLKQANEALYELAKEESRINDAEINGISSTIKGALTKIRGGRGSVREVSDVIRVLQPFGVYNNRGTHDSQTPFTYNTGASTREIIGVNISNYCFMRDVSRVMRA